MKYLFYLLLLGNIVFYLWESGRQPHADMERIELKLPDTGEPIRLLKELPAPIKKPSASTAPPEVAEISPPPPAEPPPVELVSPPPVKPTVDPQCRLIGPFGDSDSAHNSLDQLQSRLDGLTVVSRTDATVEGYWVLYPRAENIYAARANRKMLSDKGIRDLWLFDKGELEGSISLGVFKTRDRAETMQQQLKTKDIEVEIKPRLTRAESFWLQLSWNGSETELRHALGADAEHSIKNCDS
jgi:hypothetical protein